MKGRSHIQVLVNCVSCLHTGAQTLSTRNGGMVLGLLAI